MIRTDVSDSVKAKAERLREQGCLKQDQEYPDVWSVRSGGNLYRVQVGGEGSSRWATCSCRYGRNNSYRIGCAHALAVLDEIDGRPSPE